MEGSFAHRSLMAPGRVRIIGAQPTSTSNASTTMMHLIIITVALLLQGVVHAFQIPRVVVITATPRRRQDEESISSSSSALQAAPIFISGMIRKMKDDQAKRSMPQASAAETAMEAPGLRVGREAWRWPAVWPYDAAFFQPAAAEMALAPPTTPDLQGIASMISGVAQAPGVTNNDPAVAGGSAGALVRGGTTKTPEEDEATKKFDPLQYWGETQATARTNMDADAIEKLREHYSFYLEDGVSILELGAAEDSYLPETLQTSRHVGVGANPILMAENPALTETLVVDLNKVVDGRDVDSDDLRRLALDPFDVILMGNTVDYLTSPREVFRSAWYLLKPGGTMIVSFSGKDATKDKFTMAQTKAWTSHNDDQHMWIAGSFFQFSAGSGWEALLGFDVSPASAKKQDGNPVEKLLDRGKANNLYVVQATKGFQDEGIDPDNLERSINSMCWMLPVVEDRDKQLLVPRLASVYQDTDDEHIHRAIEHNIPYLPSIYEALVKMDTFAFTFAMQAQMAADLICDPGFNASDEQLAALKQGLGLRTPSNEFWVPIGRNTANMKVEDRISLLSYIVPRFGSGNEKQDEALAAFVDGLNPTYSVLKRKCPELVDADVELLGTELLASEILTLGRSTREEFAQWLAGLSADEIQQILSKRKAIREVAKQDLAAFKQTQKEEKEQQEEYRRQYEEQLQKARMERSMYFNPRTQKMEIFDNPNKKK
jgi:SAM-dependent methyltransferase